MLFNYFLISPYQFGDQFIYFHEITSLKSTGESIDYIAQTKFDAATNISSVTFTSHVLGFAPIPNFMTVTSTAFANKFFTLITFIWLSKYIDQDKLLVFFLLPSFIIYTSLGLRDTLIILTSIISLVHIANSRYIFGMIFLAPLILIKIQMFLFIGIYFFGKLFFRAHRSFNGMILMLVSVLVIILLNYDFVLEYLNYYLIGFVAENMQGGYRAWGEMGDKTLYEQGSLIGVGLSAIFKLPYFLIMPLPWQWSNPFHIALFLDAILCLSGLYYVLVKNQSYKNQEVIFLVMSLGVGLLAYSFLMQNIGTFARYRFTLFVPYLLCIYYVARRDDQ